MVRGLSLHAAVRRAGLDWDYTIIGSAPLSALAERMRVTYRHIPTERDPRALHEFLLHHPPDILIVDLAWYLVSDVLSALQCRKVLLIRMVPPVYFSIPRGGREPLELDPDAWDAVFTIEPFECPFPTVETDPVLIRNVNELLCPAEARRGLLRDREDDGRPVCLFAMNGKPGELDDARKSYAYLEDDYHVVYTTNYAGGLFPAMDYYPGADLVVCGAGYNAFWETRACGVPSVYIPQERRLDRQDLRVRHYSDRTPAGNGADQIIANLYQHYHHHGVFLKPAARSEGRLSYAVQYERMAEEAAETAEWREWDGTAGDGLED